MVIIGGGQAGLAMAYHLKRRGRPCVVLDDQSAPGGAWRHAWPSLQLFSPREASSLPGWMMPPTAGTYPTRDETIAYLTDYERRYDIAVERSVSVLDVRRHDHGFMLSTSAGELATDVVISATGTWARPMIPDIGGRTSFGGRQIHSGGYDGPAAYHGRRVLVVGAGNSSAQIVADLAAVADVTWCVREMPVFLPDDVDGRVLFDEASRRYRAMQQGLVVPATGTLGDIVMVPSIKALRDRGLLRPVPMFASMTHDGVRWADGREEHVDDVIWATGFGSVLGHLASLDIVDEMGRIGMNGNEVVAAPGLYLLGYGNWTGYASATLVGVGRAAKSIAEAIDGA